MLDWSKQPGLDLGMLNLSDRILDNSRMLNYGLPLPNPRDLVARARFLYGKVQYCMFGSHR